MGHPQIRWLVQLMTHDGDKTEQFQGDCKKGLGFTTKSDGMCDFLLTARRDRHAAQRFLEKAIRGHGVPAKITLDQSGANAAAVEYCNAAYNLTIEVRQVKYLNNIIEQDHRAIKRVVRSMLGFKAFWAARRTLAGIEVMHMIKKGQLGHDGELGRTPADWFYALAA
jgi:putative transposase